MNYNPDDKQWVDFLSQPGRLDEMVAIDIDLEASANETTPGLSIFLKAGPAPVGAESESVWTAEEKLAQWGAAVDDLLTARLHGDYRVMHSALGRLIGIPATDPEMAQSVVDWIVDAIRSGPGAS